MAQPQQNKLGSIRLRFMVFPMPQVLTPRRAFAQRLATVLDGLLYHCAHCASWYNNRKAVIIFQVAFASPPLALPAVATGEVANYTISHVVFMV